MGHLKTNLMTWVICFCYSELIEIKGKGIFDLLDEESKLPIPKPDHFTMEVHNRNKEHFRLSVSTVCRFKDKVRI